VLYFDSSALIKRYVREAGTHLADRRVSAELLAGRPLLSSVLTFAEIHRALAARKRDGSLNESAFNLARQAFGRDWDAALTVIDLGPEALSFIPNLVEHLTLKSSNAVHIASALWVRNRSGLGPRHGQSIADVTFASADLALVRAAKEQNFEVFDPQN